jgi:adenosylcobinamide kinase / adenosylcobinamide-phosphate guanylyltransferase
VTAKITLITGGARSGKSRFAESLITALPPPWTYVATAEAGDAEMAARIAEHRKRRGASWAIVEIPHELAGAFSRIDEAAPVLVDCLTFWLSNRLLAGADLEKETENLASVLARRSGPLVLVTNEVGSGIVPDNALARRFRDAQGRLNQRMAVLADRVVLVVAGLPLVLKGAL